MVVKQSTTGTASRGRVVIKRGLLASCALLATLASFLVPAALASAPTDVWLGGARPAQSLQLLFPLKVDGAGLERLATEVSNPMSPLYGHYESIPTLARRFGASSVIRRRVVEYLRSQGAGEVRIDATGLFADATVDVRLAEQLFAAPLMRFRTADGRRYIAPATLPEIPRALAGAITGVVGLDARPLANRASTLVGRSPGSTVAHVAGQQSSAQPRTGTPAGCAAGQAAGGFTPNQYLTAYDFDPLHRAGYLGQGQRVAVVEFDSVSRSDVAAFAQCFGLPVPPITEHLVGPSSPPAPGSESALDLDMLDAAAPGLGGIDVYEASNNATGFVKALTAPLQVPGSKPSVMSVSLGICEGALNNEVDGHVLEVADYGLEEATISGTTVVASSGDTGSTECSNSSGTPVFDRRLGIGGTAVNYPSTSSAVLAVGGTNLALTPANQMAEQVVWNDAPLRLTAGGGGFSADHSRPPWQVPFIPGNVGTIGTRPERAVPDVAMLADVNPGYAIYCSSADCAGAAGAPWITAGGTSAAAPLLAGGIALVDQALLARQRVYIGAPASWLYYEAENTAVRNYIFHDVTTGNNDLGPYLPGSGGAKVGCCTATAGYDEASGWGSVDITHLASEYLAAELPNIHVRVAVRLPPHQQPVKHGGIIAVVSCTTDCNAYASVHVSIGRAGSFWLYSPGHGWRTLRTAGSTRFVFRFTPAELAALRSALRRHVRIVATVSGSVENPREILSFVPTPSTVAQVQAVERVAITS